MAIVFPIVGLVVAVCFLYIGCLMVTSLDGEVPTIAFGIFLIIVGIVYTIFSLKGIAALLT